MESINEIEQIEDIELRALKYFCYITRTQMLIEYYETGNNTKIIGFMKECCIRRIKG